MREVMCSRPTDRIKHWRELWRNGIFWQLLWLTVRYPRTPKHCWITAKGYEVRLHG